MRHLIPPPRATTTAIQKNITHNVFCPSSNVVTKKHLSHLPAQMPPSAPAPHHCLPPLRCLPTRPHYSCRHHQHPRCHLAAHSTPHCPCQAPLCYRCRCHPCSPRAGPSLCHPCRVSRDPQEISARLLPLPLLRMRPPHHTVAARVARLAKAAASAAAAAYPTRQAMPAGTPTHARRHPACRSERSRNLSHRQMAVSACPSPDCRA
jgi:hypothetical protein